MDFSNFKEIVCNNDVINKYEVRQKYIENKCFNYQYIKNEYPNSNYHILQNSKVDMLSKEFLQKMFYDVFLQPLTNCKFWNAEYNFNYLENDFTTILQVVVFWNENLSNLDFEGDLDTLKQIEFDKIQRNFVTFQNQCIFLFDKDVCLDFTNKQEREKICDLENDIENYLQKKYADNQEKLTEYQHLFRNHFGQNCYNYSGEDFNIIQTFGGDNFDGFFITRTDQ